MDVEFWLERWQSNDIGFHRDDFNPHLLEHWPELKLDASSSVFVPLCGKSRDMVWLASRGHRVIGVELSALAVEQFFAENQLIPERKAAANHQIYSAGPFEIWCGDIFAMPAEELDDIAAVYDRASLIALPPELQKRYAAFMRASLPSATPMLLLTLTYDQSKMKGPPFSVPVEDVRTLYSDGFDIEERAHTQVIDANKNLQKRGLTSVIESCYVLRRKQEAGEEFQK